MRNSQITNNQILVIVILGAILFFCFILPMIESDKKNEKLTNTDETLNHGPKMDQNLCSRACCKHTQWPLPEELKSKDLSEDELKKYIGNNFSCNNGAGSGCMCMDQSQFNYLVSRGQN